MKICRLPHRNFFLSLLLGVALPLTHVRAQSPGDLDTSFTNGPESSGSVRAIALQANGGVIVGGGFTAFRSVTRNGLARVDASGNLDTSFNPGLAISGYNGGTATIQAVQVQADGSILAAGIFNVLNQEPGGGVVRLFADGTLDSSFDVGTGVVDGGGIVGTAYALAVQPDGKILVGGDFTTFNNVATAGLVRLLPDGSVDPTFNLDGSGITHNDYGQDVRSIVLLANGQILIGGHFSAYDGKAAGCVARLNADGTPDTTFNVGKGADYGVFALAVQSDGKILVGGGYNTFDGATVPHLVRLTANGTLDTSYVVSGELFISEIDALFIRPDGSAIIAGSLRDNGGLVTTARGGLSIVEPDGTENPDFGPSDSFQAVALVPQPDGKVIVAYDNDGFAATGPGDVFRIYDVSATPAATITAGVSKANEDGSGGPATFVVTLSSAPGAKTVVHYSLKGSATNGVDYQGLSGKAKFKAGQTSKTITLTPINRHISSGGALKVKAALVAGSGYTLGSPSGAKVKIIEND